MPTLIQSDSYREPDGLAVGMAIISVTAGHGGGLISRRNLCVVVSAIGFILRFGYQPIVLGLDGGLGLEKELP